MADREDRKSALIARLDEQRGQLSRRVAGVRANANLAARLRGTMTRHWWVWGGSAVVLGVVLSRWRPRRTSVRQAGGETVKKAGQAGLLMAIAKIAFDVAKPTILSWVTSRIGDYVNRPDHGRPRHRS